MLQTAEGCHHVEDGIWWLRMVTSFADSLGFCIGKWVDKMGDEVIHDP